MHLESYFLFYLFPYSDEWNMSAPPPLFQLDSPRISRQSVISGHHTWVIFNSFRFYLLCSAPSLMGDDADKFFKEMISSHHQLFRRILTLCCCFVCVALFFLYATKNQQWPRRPRPASSHQFYPSNWTLVNLKNFEFLLNSDACGTRQIDLLVIVTSHPGHVALRNAFRRALPIEALRTFNITRVFLLAQINPTQTGYHQVDQHVIEEEHINYNDIVQGDSSNRMTTWVISTSWA